MTQPLSAVSFFYFWVAVLSFFHNYFLLRTLHFCIKSIIKIVVVVVTFAASHYEKVETQALRLNRASNMVEDYTVYAKQNELVRSHDFWLKSLIQYYL